MNYNTSNSIKKKSKLILHGRDMVIVYLKLKANTGRRGFLREWNLLICRLD